MGETACIAHIQCWRGFVGFENRSLMHTHTLCARASLQAADVVVGPSLCLSLPQLANAHPAQASRARQARNAPLIQTGQASTPKTHALNGTIHVD